MVQTQWKQKKMQFLFSTEFLKIIFTKFKLRMISKYYCSHRCNIIVPPLDGRSKTQELTILQRKYKNQLFQMPNTDHLNFDLTNK